MADEDQTGGGSRSNAGCYTRFALLETPDTIVIVPKDQDGSALEDAKILTIDKLNSVMTLEDAENTPEAEPKRIYGIVGIIKLPVGAHLIVITGRMLVATVCGHDIYTITDSEVIPFSATSLHLDNGQELLNKKFVSMLEAVLATPGFYFSYTYDLTYSMQRLDKKNKEKDFKTTNLLKRADPMFIWNTHAYKEFLRNPKLELGRFLMPIMHGFVGAVQAAMGDNEMQLGIISRRSCHRAGTRFGMRGIDDNGHAANFVETEQILEYKETTCSYVQIRGSIPLYWSQLVDLEWQPKPRLTKGQREQAEGYGKHAAMLRAKYAGDECKLVYVDLVNRKGKELIVGDALDRTTTQYNDDQNTDDDKIAYVPFDFHHRCKSNWDRGLAELVDNLSGASNSFKYFAKKSDKVESWQKGYFRANCMDCLDRTNVVQSLLAKAALTDQLTWLQVLAPEEPWNNHPNFDSSFKNLWADNGDMISIQYAGTGALKADFTRLGKRTVQGKLNDGTNALTRYYLNNFCDGYRQDAIGLFLGTVDAENENTEAFKENVYLKAASVMLALFILIFLHPLYDDFDLSWLVVGLAGSAAILGFMKFNYEMFVDRAKVYK